MKDHLKQMFTSYWQFLALKAACRLNLFDLIHAGCDTPEKLTQQEDLHEGTLKTLLLALEQAEVLAINNGKISLTADGYQLTSGATGSLKEACILWGEEHMHAWMHLDYTVKTGLPAFEKLYGCGFFDYIASLPDKLQNYHKAMDSYAADDYGKLPVLFDFSEHGSIMDVGGGLGFLIQKMAEVYPEKVCILFDKPEVIAISPAEKIRKIGGDFFKKLPSGSDAIFLTRVLHDWDDVHCLKILANCYAALPEGGSLYVIENLTDRAKTRHALLELNMRIICKSFERSEEQYRALLTTAGFDIQEIVQVNEIQFMIKTQKI